MEHRPPHPAVALISVVHDLARARSLADIEWVIRNRVRALLGADGVALIIREGEDLVRYVEEDALEPLWKGQRFRLDQCVSGVAIQRREPVYTANVFADPRVPKVPYEGKFIQSLAMMPLRADDPVGAIGFYWAEPHEVTPDEDILLRGLAESAAIAVENTRLIERLEAEQCFSEAVIDSLPGVFYVIDDKGRYRRWNRNSSVVTGYSDDEIRHMHPLDFFAGDDRRRIGEAMREVFERGWSTVEAQLVTKRGERIPYAFTGLRSQIEGAPHIVGVGLDISERITLEEQLRHAQKMEAIGRLAGGVAHDFNNLLACISTMATIASRKAKTQGAVAQSLREIRETALRAGDLTRHLLALGRRQPLDIRIHDLNEVVSDMTRILSRLLGERIRVETQLTDREAPAEVDRAQIEQVLLNLALNAFDAMPDGGTLSIATAVSDRRVQLEVNDTGDGIDPEIKERIFEPFFTTKEKGRGTGLGLSTVYGVVQQHGGDIDVWSEPGRGARFTVRLPLSEERPAPTEPTVEEEAALEGRGETLLLVEDDPTVRRVAADALIMCGYHVLTAQSGPDAVAVSAGYRAPIQLLLTDVIMPSLTGVQLRKRLHAARPELKVLYMSGYAGNVLSEQEIDAKQHRLLRKPFSVDQLCRTVREALDEGE